MSNPIFSEFFVDSVGIKPAGADATVICDCMGTLDEEINVKTVTKSCRGRVKKSRTKGGDGKLKLTLHMPYALYQEIYGMNDVKLATGVAGYGPASMHKECVITAKVLDEDDVVKYKAYPCATVSSNKISKVDDGATEVPMVELEFAITPDDNDLVVYEALEDELDGTAAQEWIGNWSSELVVAEV